MKIGVNTRLLQEKYYTGIQNYIESLYQEINKIDKKNKYVFLKNHYGNSPLKNVFYDNFLIKKQIKKSHIDLFHAANTVLPLGAKNCRYLTTVHDLGFKAFPKMSKKANIVYLDFAFKNIAKKADLIVTDSFAVKREIKKYYHIKESRLKVVPLGVDNFYFKKESKKYLEKTKKQYHLSNQKVIFTNSAHSNRKNIGLLIKMFTNNRNYFKNTRLIICGLINKDAFQEIIKNKKENNILLLGYVPKRKLRAFYQITNIFIYPSLYEGFGLPLLEAMASGTLTLASNIPVFREIIPDNNFLFDPLKANDVFEKAKYYLNIGSLKKESLIKKYKKILKSFTWPKTAKKMINIFDSF